jgi:integrase
MNARITEYLTEIRRTRSPKTVENYEEMLHRYSNYLRGRSDFSRAMAVSFLLSLQEKQFGEASVSLHQATLKSFFTWMTANGYLDRNPLEQNAIHAYHSPKRPDEFIFSQSEYEKLKAACLKIQNPSHLFWHDAVVCAWNTGLRLQDVAYLDRGQVQLLARKITVRPKKTTRLAKVITIPILPELYAVLDKSTLSPLFFPEMAASYDRNGNKALSVFFGRLLKSIGITGKSFHGLRHSAASRMLVRGVPTAIVCSITGQSIQTVQRYMHVPFEDKQRAIEKALL